MKIDGAPETSCSFDLLFLIDISALKVWASEWQLTLVSVFTGVGDEQQELEMYFIFFIMTRLIFKS